MDSTLPPKPEPKILPELTEASACKGTPPDLNFLLGFIDLCKDTEIPGLFAAWSGIAGLSCALGRRCWIDMGTFIIYPNMYILLVGGSGRVRKSTSISMIERIIRRLQPRPNLIAQKITPEALVDALRLYETADKHTIRLHDRCEGFVVVDELSTFLNKQSYEAGLGSLLIPLYDCKDEWVYKTKSGGDQVLTNVCLGMLSASTTDWITAAIPEGAVGGGLTSRIIFVYVKDPAPPIARPQFGEAKKKLLENLERRLTEITKLEGEFKLTVEAWELYEKEYYRFAKTPEGKRLFEDAALTGYASRRAMHQLKIAMAFSASERADRIICLSHVQGAIDVIAQTEKTMPMVISLITATQMGNLIAFVQQIIDREGKVSRNGLLRQLTHKIGHRELDVVIDTLIAARKIKSLVQGNAIYYLKEDYEE